MRKISTEEEDQWINEEEDRKMLGGSSSRRWSVGGLRATARTEKEKSSGFCKKPKTKMEIREWN